MKKIFFITFSILFVQCTTYAMKESEKKSLWSKMFTTASRHEEGEISIDRAHLLNNEPEILPNLYIAALAQCLDKTPKEFLDSRVQCPNISVREYLAVQEFRDTYFHASKEEHHEHINNFLSRVFLEQDENLFRSIINVHEKNLITMNFAKIREFLQKILREKMRNEQIDSQKVIGKMISQCLLGLNVGAVAGAGVFLWKHTEYTSLSYATLGIALSGMCIVLPTLYRCGNSLYHSRNRLREYAQKSKILESKITNEVTTTYRISN